MSETGLAPHADPPRRDVPRPAAWRSPPWAALGLFATFFVVALLSLWRTAAGADWYERVYRSIAIFTADSSWAFADGAKTGRLFKILTIVAPLLTAVTFAELITGFARPAFTRRLAAARIRFGGSKGIAVVGLDEASFAFACAAKASGYVPAIFAQNADPALIAGCLNAGIALFHDSPGRASLPLIGRTKNLTDLVSFLPTENAQIDLAAQLDAGARVHLPKVWLFMPDRGVAQRLDEYLKFAGQSRNGRRRLHPRLIYPPALAAVDVLTRHPFDTLADAFGQTQIHLAIYGFGGLGRAIAKHAAQLYVTRASLTGSRLRITVIDRDPQAAHAALLAEDPGIEKVVDIACLAPAELAGAGLTESQACTLLPADVTGHIITIGDPRRAFTLAVSMRRWLLEPPAHVDADWRAAHAAAPVFVHTPDSTGLGRLLRFPGDGGPRMSSLVPEGIFGFGAMQTILAPEALVKSRREVAAMALHTAYANARARVEATEPAGQVTHRAAEANWESLPPAFRDSNFQAAEHIPIKARAIGYRFVPKRAADPKGALPPEGSEALAVLAELEHRRYVAERQTSGWRHAASRCNALRVHPDLVDWDRLSPGEKHLDIEQIHALPEVARQIGHRFAKALFIGVAGHRTRPPGRLNRDWVRARLRDKLVHLCASNAGRAPVLLTALAPGADSWAADIALDLHIPFIVPLPLPHEVHSEDFAPAELADFHRLIAGAEYFFELPLRFGRASDLTLSDPATADRNSIARAGQYALAGAYIVAHAHAMIGVWDLAPGGGPGGTADILSWTPETIPPQYRTPSAFFPRPDTHEKLIIPARPELAHACAPA